MSTIIENEIPLDFEAVSIKVEPVDADLCTEETTVTDQSKLNEAFFPEVKIESCEDKEHHADGASLNEVHYEVRQEECDGQAISNNKSIPAKGKMNRKKRAPNFTRVEEEFLVDLIHGNEVIENKRTDAIAWKEKKEAWIQIWNDFNAGNPAGVARSVEELQLKYTNLKRAIKQKTAFNRSLLSTGGVPTDLKPFTESEEKLKATLSLSDESFLSVFDSNGEICSEGSPMEEEATVPPTPTPAPVSAPSSAFASAFAPAPTSAPLPEVERESVLRKRDGIKRRNKSIKPSELLEFCEVKKRWMEAQLQLCEKEKEFLIKRNKWEEDRRLREEEDGKRKREQDEELHSLKRKLLENQIIKEKLEIGKLKKRGFRNEFLDE